MGRRSPLHAKCILTQNWHSQTTSTTTMGLAGAVSRDGSHILNTSNLHASTRQSPQSTLCPWPGCLALGATGCPQLDMQCSDDEFLATCSHILRRQHGGIWRGLIAIGLHLHPPCDPRECLAS